MKKLSIYSLLVLFLLSVVGGQYLLFHAFRIHVRQQAKQTLREMAFDEAEVLGFSNEELSGKLPFIRVADKEDEIIFNGEYFDVKAATFSGDSVFLYAYRDTKEKQLVEVYTKKAQNDNSNPTVFFLHHFSHLFVFEATASINLATTTFPKKSIAIPYICSLPQSVVFINYPPPKIG